MNSKLEYYISLFNYTYDDLVDYLLDKYGAGIDDYYREKSYMRFMKGEIKSITKGKYSRTEEGLFAHHIDENKKSHLSTTEILKKKKIPYKYQKKERLVYCDLIEHAILHVLIMKETDGKLGTGGLIFMIPYIENWYVHKEELSVQWMINCREKAFLTKEDALILLEKFEQISFVKDDKIKKLELLYFSNREEYENRFESKKSFIEYYSQFPYASDETTAEIVKSQNKAIEKRKEYNKIKAKEQEERKRKAYNFSQERIKNGEDISRQDILRDLYNFKYHKEHRDFESFNSAMMPILKEDLVREFQLIEYTPYNMNDRIWY